METSKYIVSEWVSTSQKYKKVCIVNASSIREAIAKAYRLGALQQHKCDSAKVEIVTVNS